MSHPDSVVSCESHPGFSDHNIVLANISNQLIYFKQPPRKIHLFKKANWDVICHDLLLASNMYLNLNSTSSGSVEENWAFFHQQYLILIQKYVPSKTLSTSHHLPWLSPSLKRLIKKKQRLYSNAKIYNKPADWVEYKTLQHRFVTFFKAVTTTTYTMLSTHLVTLQTANHSGGISNPNVKISLVLAA